VKCTNKKLTILLLVIVFSLFTGCGKTEIPFAYDPDYEVSSFRVSTEASAPVADAFAKDLCVVTGDINVDVGTVDMSQATAAGLFDLNNHEVLYAKNIHERLHPASLTKIMTALVALKYGKPEDRITVTDGVYVNESGAVKCGLEAGDQLTLNQALHALLMKSANDAANAIAIHIAGTVEDFADLMNKEATAIGATNSHFVNPHGLTAEDHYVTAYDMYLMFQEAVKYELINEIIHKTSYELVYTDKNGAQKSNSLNTTNLYLEGTQKAPDQISVIGGKTGTTNAARNCLVLLSKDISGNPYISVILSSEERGVMYTEMSDLLDEIQN